VQNGEKSAKTKFFASLEFDFFRIQLKFALRIRPLVESCWLCRLAHFLVLEQINLGHQPNYVCFNAWTLLSLCVVIHWSIH